MHTRILLVIVAVFTVSVCGPMPVGAQQTKAKEGTAAATKDDVVTMLNTLQKLRADAWKRIEQNRPFMEGGRPGLTAAQINQDKGMTEACDWMIHDLEALLKSNPSPPELVTRLQALQADWQKRRTQAWQRVMINRPFLEGGGRPGLTGAQINQDMGMTEAFDGALKLVANLVPEPPAKPPTPPATKPITGDLSPEEILPLLPNGIVTAEDLSRFLERNKAIGLKPETIDRVIELFNRQRSRAIQGLLGGATELLDSTPLVLSCDPASPVAWDADAGQVTVQVAADESSLEGVLSWVRTRLSRLAGSTPTFTIRYGWTGPGGKTATPPQESPRHAFKFTEPKSHSVSVVRWITIQCDVKGDDEYSDEVRDVVETTFAAKGEMTIEVKPLAFPEDIAGIWRGRLVINEMPLADAMAQKLKETPREAPSEKSDGPLEGCEIPPEVFDQIVARLKSAQGQPLGLVAEISTSSGDRGTMTVTISPPESWQAQRGRPVPINFRYAAGSLVAELERPEDRMKMRATFKPAMRGWTMEGSWQFEALVENRWMVAASGSWNATNPDCQ